MKKNRIRLTESQLHRVIKESVNKILKEVQLGNQSLHGDNPEDWKAMSTVRANAEGESRKGSIPGASKSTPTSLKHHKAYERNGRNFEDMRKKSDPNRNSREWDNKHYNGIKKGNRISKNLGIGRID